MLPGGTSTSPRDKPTAQPMLPSAVPGVSALRHHRSDVPLSVGRSTAVAWLHTCQHTGCPRPCIHPRGEAPVVSSSSCFPLSLPGGITAAAPDALALVKGPCLTPLLLSPPPAPWDASRWPDAHGGSAGGPTGNTPIWSSLPAETWPAAVDDGPVQEASAGPPVTAADGQPAERVRGGMGAPAARLESGGLTCWVRPLPPGCFAPPKPTARLNPLQQESCQSLVLGRVMVAAGGLGGQITWSAASPRYEHQ